MSHTAGSGVGLGCVSLYIKGSKAKMAKSTRNGLEWSAIVQDLLRYIHAADGVGENWLQVDRDPIDRANEVIIYLVAHLYDAQGNEYRIKNETNKWGLTWCIHTNMDKTAFGYRQGMCTIPFNPLPLICSCKTVEDTCRPNVNVPKPTHACGCCGSIWV